MALSIFTITQIIQSTQTGTDHSDIRLVGHYESEPISPTRQVILRRGAQGTDLAMKKGQGGWELEILVPPLTYSVLAALIAYGPEKCSFDRSDSASEFHIGSAFHNTTRTVEFTLGIR